MDNASCRFNIWMIKVCRRCLDRFVFGNIFWLILFGLALANNVLVFEAETPTDITLSGRFARKRIFKPYWGEP